MENYQKINTIDALFHIKFNPIKYGAYLASFYNSGIVNVQNNILLAPLILPLCEHSSFIKGKRIQRNSTLNSVFGNYKKSLPDLKDRIFFFKDLTFNSIQYCLVNNYFLINPKLLKIEHLGEMQKDFPINKKIQDLGEKLFSRYTVEEIYLFFGVKCSEIFYS